MLNYFLKMQIKSMGKNFSSLHLLLDKLLAAFLTKPFTFWTTMPTFG
jgi:ACR3 family arsenite efflux pump ArsB